MFFQLPVISKNALLQLTFNGDLQKPSSTANTPWPIEIFIMEKAYPFRILSTKAKVILKTGAVTKITTQITMYSDLVKQDLYNYAQLVIDTTPYGLPKPSKNDIDQSYFWFKNFNILQSCSPTKLYSDPKNKPKPAIVKPTPNPTPVVPTPTPTPTKPVVPKETPKTGGTSGASNTNTTGNGTASKVEYAEGADAGYESKYTVAVVLFTIFLVLLLVVFVLLGLKFKKQRTELTALEKEKNEAVEEVKKLSGVKGAKEEII